MINGEIQVCEKEIHKSKHLSLSAIPGKRGEKSRKKVD